MKLYYREYGKGPPVVLLHGLLGSSENWHTVARSLAGSYRAIVPDLRNHGKSPHSSDFNYPLLAADLRELIGALRLTKPVLVGHSMGGKTAMELALEAPDIPKAVVVEDMIPGQTQGPAGKYIRMLLELDLAGATRRKELEEQLLDKTGDKRLTLFLLKNLVRNQDKTFSWRSNMEAIAANYDAIWKSLTPRRSWDGPILFLRGGESEVVADESYEEIFSFFPGAKIVTIERAGHWAHGEEADEFLRQLRGFLTQVIDGG